MKKNNIILVLIIISIFILGYNKTKEYYYNKGLQNGLNRGLYTIIKQAKNKNCNTIKIGNNNEKIELINIKCLKK